MLQFFSASTSIVNSKRAITECLENALEGQGSLDCDLLIIYSAMGHNFKDLLSEARRLSPGARIAGCTCAGVIGKTGPDESMTALAIMAVKGPKNEFALVCRSECAGRDPAEVTTEMARELKDINPDISILQYLPPMEFWTPYDKNLEGIKSVFGREIPVFGGVAMDNFKGISCFDFFDEQIIEKGAVLIGFADPTLKYISMANHGFDVIEGVSFEVTRYETNRMYEINSRPAWPLFTATLGVPETINFVEIIPIAAFAKQLPEDLHDEYGSKYILFVSGRNFEDNSFETYRSCKKGERIWLTKRDEKKMFDGVDWMIKRILDLLDAKKPLAVFHADCALRGRLSLNRILKDEIINRIQYPLCKGANTPWLGLYSGGEFAMLGGESWFHQLSSSLFVIYRE
jgi:hypothetical protein